MAWEGWAWALGGCDAWHCLASTERLPLRAAGEGGAAGAWRPGPALPTARRSVGGCEWRGRLVSAGGSDGASSLRRVDWLGAGAAAWRPGPELRRARAALGLAVLHDVLYAVGGFDGKDFLSCVECLYEPDGEWTTLCAPPAPRAALAAQVRPREPPPPPAPDPRRPLTPSARRSRARTAPPRSPRPRSSRPGGRNELPHGRRPSHGERRRPLYVPLCISYDDVVPARLTRLGSL